MMLRAGYDTAALKRLVIDEFADRENRHDAMRRGLAMPPSGHRKRRPGNRADRLLADDVTDCDPNGLLAGGPALSAHTERFRQSVPGGQFHIRAVLRHHDRSLADWDPGAEGA
ncbi:MAG: hypothetical protein J2P53_00500 [Bradyrhizobiaceae bacterium]|nr:hypothetical protein [Bradyrhizobiaceae bacterium]